MAELRTIARPYAKAAFQQAAGQSELPTWSAALRLLAELSQADTVSMLIASPALTAQQKGAQICELCGDKLSSNMTNFVHVLAENKRLELMPEIAQLFDELKAEQESSVNVFVRSAFPLDADAESQLAAALNQKLQRDVTVETVVDQSLLGGALIKAGDIVIDSSIKGRLAKLAEAMNV
jgi:F-type H+-transporting ATPase subunit delta